MYQCVTDLSCRNVSRGDWPPTALKVLTITKNKYKKVWKLYLIEICYAMIFMKELY